MIVKKNGLFLPVSLTALLFLSCDLEDRGTPPDNTGNDEALFGTWFMELNIINGIAEWAPNTMIFKSDGSYELIYYDDFNLNVDTFSGTWVTGDRQNISIYWDNGVLSWSGNYSVNGNILAFTFSLDSNLNEQTFVKQSYSTDLNAVGDWVVIDITADDKPVYGVGHVILQSNNTGSIIGRDSNTDETDVDTILFRWTVTEDRAIILPENREGLGYVMTYTLNENNLFLTNYNNDGELIGINLVRDTGSTDTNLLGAWVRTSMKIDGTEVDGYAKITLNNRNQGNYTSWSGIDDFTWSVNDRYFLLFHQNGLALGYKYTVSNNTLTFTYGGEDDEGEFVEIVETYTGNSGGDINHDPALIGTWYLEHIASDENISWQPQTLVFTGDSSGTRTCRDENERIVFEEFTWQTVNDNTITIWNSEGEVELAGSYLVANDVATFEYYDQDKRLEIEQVMVRGTGEVDIYAISTWVEISSTINGQPGYMRLALDLHENRSASRIWEEDDIVMTEEFIWSVTNDRLILLHPTGLARVLGYTYEENNIVTSYYDKYGSSYERVMHPESGAQNFDILGSWQLISRTIDGENAGGAATVVYYSDGTGMRSENNIRTDFSWTTDEEYLFIYDESGLPLLKHYTLNENRLVQQYFWNNESDELVIVVDVYER